jgi:hypothetical protein
MQDSHSNNNPALEMISPLFNKPNDNDNTYHPSNPSRNRQVDHVCNFGPNDHGGSGIAAPSQSHMARMCYCHAHTEGWYDSGPMHSCDEACRNVGLRCDEQEV